MPLTANLPQPPRKVLPLFDSSNIFRGYAYKANLNNINSGAVSPKLAGSSDEKINLHLQLCEAILRSDWPVRMGSASRESPLLISNRQGNKQDGLR